MIEPGRAEREAFAQDEWEFCQMLRYIKGFSSILEIGTRYGEALKRMAEVLHPGSRVVSVDLGQDPYSSDDTLTAWKNTGEYLKKEGFDTHFIQGDSHDQAIIEKARSLSPYDFVFIDGDHTIAGTRMDFETYGAMAHIIGLHDVCLPTVRPVWKRFKVTHKTIEIINYARGLPPSDMGIGLIFKD